MRKITIEDDIYYLKQILMSNLSFMVRIMLYKYKNENLDTISAKKINSKRHLSLELILQYLPTGTDHGNDLRHVTQTCYTLFWCACLSSSGPVSHSVCLSSECLSECHTFLTVFKFFTIDSLW